jgi:ParB-like chromosome segregation protein Spo0J
MTVAVKLGFETETVKVPIAKILPTKVIPSGPATGSKAKTIEASVPVVGVIEAPMVHRQADGTFLLLDGHRRIAALKERGAKEVECLVAFDDEAYSFNNQVSSLAPIQANKMIVKALDAGVPEERLASALGRSLATIRHSRSLLNDISPDALELLKDKPVASATFRYLKHVVPVRQLEMAELMIKMNNYSKTYAAGLVSRTKPEQVAVLPPNSRRGTRKKPEDLARMELEMDALERDILLIDESYGRDVVNLTIARGYVKKLLENAKVVKYLAAKHADLLTEFQRIQEAASLEA